MSAKLSTIDVAALRKEYTLRGLRKADVDSDPMRQFGKWFEEAVAVQPAEANAMTLATCTPDGKPTARVMLLKGFDERGFLFFTNYASRKGRQLEANPRAALNFFWAPLERQVCIAGALERVSREESDAYFHSRPVGSQLGAWASTQSSVVPDRDWLEARLDEVTERYRGAEVPLPPTWGGFVLKPETIEFWQGRPNRLHDRIQYSRQPDGMWKLERLSP